MSVSQYRGVTVKLSFIGTVYDSSTGGTATAVNVYDANNALINSQIGALDKLILQSVQVSDNSTGSGSLLLLSSPGGTVFSTAVTPANLLMSFEMSGKSPPSWHANAEGLACGNGIIPSLIYSGTGGSFATVYFSAEALWVPATTIGNTPPQYNAAQTGA